MKEQGDFAQTVVIEQLDGGYIFKRSGLGNKDKILMTFTDVVNQIAREFDLIKVGESIELKQV
jgi:hypothetical protein